MGSGFTAAKFFILCNRFCPLICNQMVQILTMFYTIKWFGTFILI